jgi:cytochrome c oxidase subunit 2
MFSVWALIWSFLVAGAVAAYAIWGRRTRPRGALPPQVEGNRPIEITWTLVLLVGAVIMLTHPIAAEFSFDRVPNAATALTVRVIGHQWWWEYRYPVQGIVTADELHIPVGRVIRLETTSADVIHAFVAPRLGGKDWAMPGRVTTIWIQADQPGVYQGQCTEFCGASHARMLARVFAEPSAEFDAWVEKMAHPVIRPTGPLAQQGEREFMTGACQACHTIGGTSARGTVGPNLTLFGARGVLSGGVLSNTPANLAAWLHDPASIKPDSVMPNLHLTNAQIDRLVAFLEGLK